MAATTYDLQQDEIIATNTLGISANTAAIAAETARAVAAEARLRRLTNYRGAVANSSKLPASAAGGDWYITLDNSHCMVWNEHKSGGAGFDDIGAMTDNGVIGTLQDQMAGTTESGLKTKIDALDGAAVKLTGEQTIHGETTFDYTISTRYIKGKQGQNELGLFAGSIWADGGGISLRGVEFQGGDPGSVMIYPSLSETSNSTMLLTPSGNLSWTGSSVKGPGFAAAGLPDYNNKKTCSCPASGGTCAAPCNGYFRLKGIVNSGVSEGYVEVWSSAACASRSSLSGAAVVAFIPIIKGENVTVKYSGITNQELMFYACVAETTVL